MSAPPLQISPVNLQLNTNDSYAFRASGGVPPYSFSITTAGTSDTISPAGQFTANATGTVSVEVSDSLTNTAGTPATVTVVSAGGGGTLILSPGSPLTGSGSAVTIPGDRTLYLVASGGTGSYTGGISITSGKGSAPQTVGSTGDTWTYTSGGNLGNSTLTLTDSVSNTATAKVTFEPTAPSNLVATAVSGTEIDLTWTNNTSSSSISGIDIYRAVGNGGFGSTPIASALAGSLSSYQDTGLSSGTVYVYKVVAVKNGVGGPFNGTSNYAVAATQ